VVGGIDGGVAGGADSAVGAAESLESPPGPQTASVSPSASMIAIAVASRLTVSTLDPLVRMLGRQRTPGIALRV